MATRKANDTIDVTIYDTAYTLRGGSDPAAVRDLARDLDDRMKALASAAPAADPLKVAILCALRLSDEAREAREALAALEQAVSGRIEACAARIDRLLLSGDAGPSSGNAEISHKKTAREAGGAGNGREPGGTNPGHARSTGA